jgi:hypothetical protein
VRPRLHLGGDEGADVLVLVQVELGQQVVLAGGGIDLRDVLDIVDEVGGDLVRFAELAFHEDENGRHHGGGLPIFARRLARRGAGRHGIVRPQPIKPGA